MAPGAAGQEFPPGAEGLSDSDANPPARLTEDSPAVRVELIAEGFDAPVFLTQPDDESGRLFVVDQVGSIRIVTSDGELRDEPFLDIGDELIELDEGYDERGLLGLAFHPEYAENGRFFVYYSAPARDEAPEEWDHTSVLAEYEVSEDPNLADPDSARTVLEIDQPFGNHNAGQILFGDDGYLFVPLGDGGDGGDTDPEDEPKGRPERGHAQTVSNFLGTVLRIDVDSELPYAVPVDNEFVERPGLDEIYSYGLRNPYGFSKDLETGDLYAFEAGQALFEEVNRIENGGNYGWNILEGSVCFNPDNHLEPLENCRERGYFGEELIMPVLEYQRSPEVGSVVVPGVMYRGEAIPDFQGKILFGDYSRIRFIPEGVIYLGEPEEGGPGDIEQVRVANPVDRRTDGSLNRFLLGISQDLDGEAYAMTTSMGGPAGGTGEVYLLTSVDEEPAGRSWSSWMLIGFAIVIVATLILGLVRRRIGNTAGRDP